MLKFVQMYICGFSHLLLTTIIDHNIDQLLFLTNQFKLNENL